MSTAGSPDTRSAATIISRFPWPHSRIDVFAANQCTTAANIPATITIEFGHTGFAQNSRILDSRVSFLPTADRSAGRPVQ